MKPKVYEQLKKMEYYQNQLQKQIDSVNDNLHTCHTIKMDDSVLMFMGQKRWEIAALVDGNRRSNCLLAQNFSMAWSGLLLESLGKHAGPK